MRKSNLLFFVCFCFSLLSCDPSARDGIITGYTITCSPQKETYTLGDKIKITVDYGALKNSYRNLFIEIDGWEFLTEVVGLEKDRLYPSIYLDDDEAFEIWNKTIGIAPDRIFRFGKADNFWEHGAGPCGPCSEVYYDRGPEHGCGKPTCTVGCDCDRYIEVWNNVFSQFVNDGEGNYTEMTHKNIDTGMGLERLACVCQNVGSLFDVDTVRNITSRVSELTGAHYHENEKSDVSLRVITDHIRASVMMIGDGVLPSNAGRGYVLRRLLRRAARHGKLLGVEKPFLHDVVDTVIHENESAYPDLREKQGYITKVVRTEEENFGRTLDGGMKIYNDMLSVHREKGETVFSGADAFRLYDTFGFPIDLTIEMAAEAGMTVDRQAFDGMMEQQKTRARKAREALGDLGWAGIEFGSDMPATEFVGYDQDTAEAKILAIVAEDGLQDEISAGVEASIVLDRTPFYAEMGGQSADHGTLSGKDFAFTVSDVQKNKGGKFLHTGVLERGALKVGDTVTASIDTKRRAAIRRAHSATHLLDAALKKVLGDHVQQAGSLVEPDRLRFDFTHFEAVTPEQLKEISDLVNGAILDGLPVVTEVLPIEEARKKGAVAVFGEKYGETVRVVEMGDFSMEFCGGTHLDNTAKVGLFRVKSESSIASGVRRMEATVGWQTVETVERNQGMLFHAAQMLKTTPAELESRIETQMNEIRELHKTLEQFRKDAALGEARQFLLSAKEMNGLKVLTANQDGLNADELRQRGDFLRDREPAVVAVLSTVNDGKITMLAVCGPEAVKRGVKAGELIKRVCAICGGRGGGRPDSAMGGGSDLLKLDDALASVDDFVSEHVK